MILYVCVGLPRSGKSTYCKQFIRFRGNHCLISGDAVRFALTGERYNRNAEEMVHVVKYLSIKAALLNHQNVVYDGTNTTRESIQKIEQIVKEYGADIYFWIFNTSVSLCVQRAMQTKQDDLIPVITNMGNQIKSIKDYIKQNYPNNYGTITNDYGVYTF